ncbi:ThiF family adenylyltransferase [Paenibacillus alkaliterrae]|uniref:ThiF family adenylyltransferase n=1 Tax=Paenibacillus alkaliterrae TaxID=320909 RepID=UPI001F3515C9|nr:ThiF family adenylyltransferase [Paenibacillus alkaliterrae]MCF2940360.1 ThiF family adenylyltransferase [Paenibacillus alkaliterrae]
MNTQLNDSAAFTTAMTPPVDRYARQKRFAPVGESGQEALGRSRAAVVGMGALGCVIAQHLVRSGVGYVRVIDRDIIEWSNLQRQMLYNEQDVLSLLPKTQAAAGHLRAMNSSVTVDPIVADLTAANASELLADVQLIIDGSDNFSVRYLINDYSVKHNIPWIYGGAVGASGMTMTILPHQTPCYRCVYNEPPAPGTTDTCETAGVISPIVDIIASIQAAEAIKLLSGNIQALHRTLFQVDLWNHAWLPVSIASAKRTDCPCCGRQHFDYLDRLLSEPAAASLCGRNSVQITPSQPASLHLEEMGARLRKVGTITLNRYLLKIELHDNLTFILFGDGRAIIQGTDQLTKARSIYAEILGI